MTVRKKPGGWEIDIRSMPDTGKRFRRTYAVTKAEAQRLEREVYMEAVRRSLGLEQAFGDVSLEDLRDAYLEWMPHHRRSSTVAQARWELGHLCGAGPRSLMVQRVSQLDRQVFEGWRQRLLAEGLSHRSVNCWTTRANAMLNWAVKQGRIERNPIQGFEWLPEGGEHRRRHAQTLTRDEARRLVAAADELLPAAGRLLHGLLGFGSRYGETRQLRWSEIDLASGWATFTAATVKTRRTRRVPVPEDLRERLELESEGEWVFPTPEGAGWHQDTNRLRGWMRKALKAAEIKRPGFRVHDLRHTSNTLWREAGVPLEVRQAWMGHTDVRQTAGTYGHYETDEVRDLARQLPRFDVK